MRLVLHPKVYSDVDAVMVYYERVASRELADDFYAELRHFRIGLGFSLFVISLPAIICGGYRLLQLLNIAR